MVSMNSIHFVRWTQQLENSGHEVFWFDILDGGKSTQLPWVQQITGWKQKFPNFKGRYFLKKKFSFLYKKLGFLFEYDTENVFEKILLNVKPDVVHSFVLYISCAPILKVMQKHNQIPWVYSSWGSDLYYFRNIATYKQDILKVLPRINYLITDCKRDILIAKELGFKGQVLGTFPGGGGFDYEKTNKYIKLISERRIIFVKGYQGRSGRAIEVIKALVLINDQLKTYQVIVFGADKEVENYIIKNEISENIDIKILSRDNFLPHDTILKFMGEALIYIGNSNSDGMPNTLLEAIAQGAFPIQSNPRGASSEVIEHGKNGFLIENCNDFNEIKELVLNAIFNSELKETAFEINQNIIKPQFEKELILNQVLVSYNKITINEKNKFV